MKNYFDSKNIRGLLFLYTEHIPTVVNWYKTKGIDSTAKYT